MAETDRLLDRGILERIADARDDFVAERLAVGSSERRLGVAGMLLAFGAELFDQRFAVALETGVGRGLDAGRLCRLGNRRIELALRRQAKRDRILWRDVRHVPVRALADRRDRRARGADQLADLPVADLGVVLDDPGDPVG